MLFSLQSQIPGYRLSGWLHEHSDPRHSLLLVQVPEHCDGVGPGPDPPPVGQVSNKGAQ